MNKNHFSSLLIKTCVPVVLLSFASWAYPQQEQPEQEITNSVGMKLRLIEPGIFQMGAPANEPGSYDSEGPQHTVLISKTFYIGLYEVTQQEYERVMGTNPSHFKNQPNNPVELVSWYDAVEFCEKLSAAESVKYRLPTEAEWEFACRAGTATRYYWGTVVDEAYAWYGGNAGGTTHPVGQKQPNAWGLYDMAGNVYEWCNDRHKRDYYRASPPVDPAGSPTGGYRVLRGGCWLKDARSLRSYSREGNNPRRRDYIYGFRVVREVE
jgi:formylglycine-generating enzyme required for sulfatase activity